MNQLRNTLKLFNKRCFSSIPLRYIAEPLKDRTLIRVSGSEVANFLQGLITNDINHLDRGVGSMYTMFLNTRGRIMFDAIIYRTSTENMFLIECDLQGVDMFQKHLKMYRVKRKIDIASLQNEFHIYTLFNPELVQPPKELHDGNVSKQLEGLIIPCSSLNETLPEKSATCKTYKDLLIYCDPRIADLGSRIIAPVKSDIHTQISEIFNINTNLNQEHSYRWFRYNLGVGEGQNDLPIDNSFPLEANCDYLHGISFHKGCYIGQELTARTHHTGVVRKRLMPLYFKDNLAISSNDYTIVHADVNLGKLRGVVGNVGLGLLRIAKVLELKEICVSTSKATTLKPSWWPIEAPKERIGAQKS